MKAIKFLAIAFVMAMTASCSDNDNDTVTTEETSEYASAGMWCNCPIECKEDVDVFYIVSTMITKSTDSDGNESFMALLTDDEKAELASEINHVHKDIMPDSVNFFAPYYHEMTMSSYSHLTEKELNANAAKAKVEVCEAFDYYMSHYNNGRPFILVGYSQGSIMVKTLVQHMSDEQYNRMVAAYMMGFGLNAKDLAQRHMKAAAGRYDTGSIISWNSMKTVDAIFDGIWSNAVTCMNPVSWIPDDITPIPYTFDGKDLTLHVDTTKHVLIVDGLNPEDHPSLPKYDTPWSKDNYHDYETYLYCPSIRQNILDRIAAFKKK